MSDMSASRTAGYVVLTSMAAVLDIVRHGWNETRAEEEPEPAEAR